MSNSEYNEERWQEERAELEAKLLEYEKLFEAARRKAGVKCLSDLPDVRDQRIADLEAQLARIGLIAAGCSPSQLEQAVLEIHRIATEVER